MNPMIAGELVRAHVDHLRADWGSSRRKPPRQGRSSGAWRTAVGLRLVSAGVRLIGREVT